jgi:large subunit ribosomal protein L29
MAVQLDKLRNMTPEDLAQEEQQLREEIWKLRLQIATGQLQAPQKVRLARRGLARVLTVRRERQTAGSRGRTGARA